MATVTRNKIAAQKLLNGVPYGNCSVLPFVLATNAAGAMIDSDQATALNIADKVRLGILPAGFRLHDSLAIISTLFTASLTMKIGFEYVDGVDSTVVPQDDDYFYAALANAAGRTRAANTAVAPVTLDKDAYLIVTIAGANNAKAAQMDLLIYGEDQGPK